VTRTVGSAGIRYATSGDQAEVLALLAASALPLAGVEQVFPAGFIVSHDGDGGLDAVAGVEIHGTVGLLRSVAVRADRRGTGLGQAISSAAVSWARDAALTDLYLLTTTADEFFPRLGFQRVDRSVMPVALSASAELRGACPASAVAMHLRLE
jgi:amino-acid N-acetyltransferase